MPTCREPSRPSPRRGNWGQLLDITLAQAPTDLARTSATALSFFAQSGRGSDSAPVPQRRIDEASSVVEKFIFQWRGEPDPAHVTAVDAYFCPAAEHGMNASTFTARVIASTGAHVALRSRAPSVHCPARCTVARRPGC